MHLFHWMTAIVYFTILFDRMGLSLRILEAKSIKNKTAQQKNIEGGYSRVKDSQ